MLTAARCVINQIKRICITGPKPDGVTAAYLIHQAQHAVNDRRLKKREDKLNLRRAEQISKIPGKQE